MENTQSRFWSIVWANVDFEVENSVFKDKKYILISLWLLFTLYPQPNKI